VLEDDACHPLGVETPEFSYSRASSATDTGAILSVNSNKRPCPLAVGSAIPNRLPDCLLISAYTTWARASRSRFVNQSIRKARMSSTA